MRWLGENLELVCEKLNLARGEWEVSGRIVVSSPTITMHVLPSSVWLGTPEELIVDFGKRSEVP